MIQIDMQMPKNCIDCPICNDYMECAIPINGRRWAENDVTEFSKSRPEWCPMKEQEDVKPFHKCFGNEYTLIEDSGFDYCPYCGKKVFWE